MTPFKVYRSRLSGEGARIFRQCLRGFLCLLTFEERMSNRVISGEIEALLGEVPDFRVSPRGAVGKAGIKVP